MTEENTTTDDSGTIPVACTLTEEGARERERWMRTELLDHLEAIEERDDGYEFVFADEGLDAVTEFAEVEHECCPFATFELHVTPGDDENRLAMYGPEGTKDMLGRGFVEPVSAEFDHLG